MKFTIPLILLAGLCVVLATGCADTEPPPPPQTTDQPTTKPTVVTPPGPHNPAAPASAMATVAGDTTVIDGKTVTMKKLADGLQYYDMKVGTGPSPKIGQTVMVQYTGTLLDGTKFDSSYDHGGKPIGFPIGVGQVIKGWDEGVPSMKVGGKRRLVVPGELAYGANPPSAAIPANATLVFDIELVAVK